MPTHRNPRPPKKPKIANPGESEPKPKPKPKPKPPGAPGAWNKDCWAAPLDLSGIPWHSAISGAAITRRHVVTAAHWNNLPPSVRFQSRDGETVNVSYLAADPADHPDFQPTRMTVPDRRACWIHLGNDVAIATTSEPLPESIAIYPLPDPLPDEMSEEFVGRTVVSTQWSDDKYQPDPKGLRVAGLRKVARFAAPSIAFAKDPELPGELYFDAVIQDSGNPLFFFNPTSKQLILAATYSGGGGGSGPYYGNAALQEKIREYIAASPAPKEEFTTVDLTSGD
jgi:hypothetical protein